MSQIYIYEDLTHVIQEVNDDKLDLPISVNSSSITCMDAEGTNIGFEFVPYRQIFKKDIKCRVEKKNKIQQGKIISTDGYSITLLSQNEISYIRKFDSISISKQDYREHPRIILNSTQVPTYCSYHCGDIAWRCMGQLIVSEANNKMYLSVSALVTNSTNFNFDGTIYVICGQPLSRGPSYRSNNAAKLTSRRASMELASASVADTEPEQSRSEDYVMYNLGPRVLSEVESFPLNNYTFPYKKLYFARTENNDVTFGYRIQTKKYIPKCNVSVYTEGEDNVPFGNYVGTSSMKEVQPGNQIDLVIGSSTRIQCNSEVTIKSTNPETPIQVQQQTKKATKSQQITKDGQYQEDSRLQQVLTKQIIKLDTLNTTDEHITLVLRHYAPVLDPTNISIPPLKIEDGNLIWELDIKPGKNHFHCEISYYVFI